MRQAFAQQEANAELVPDILCCTEDALAFRLAAAAERVHTRRLLAMLALLPANTSTLALVTFFV